jgi:hypothetical protein
VSQAPSGTSGQIGRFLAWLERERGLYLTDHEELHRWSVEDLDGFWSAIWEHYGVRSRAPYARGARRCLDDLDVDGGEHGVEGGGELAVAVTGSGTGSLGGRRRGP